MSNKSTNFLNWEKSQLKNKIKISTKDLWNRAYTSRKEYKLFKAKYKKNEVYVVEAFVTESNPILLMWLMRNFTILQNLDCYKLLRIHVPIAWQEALIRGTVNLQTKAIIDYSMSRGVKFDGYNSSFKYPTTAYFDSIVRKK